MHASTTSSLLAVQAHATQRYGNWLMGRDPSGLRQGGVHRFTVHAAAAGDLFRARVFSTVIKFSLTP